MWKATTSVNIYNHKFRLFLNVLIGVVLTKKETKLRYKTLRK